MGRRGAGGREGRKQDARGLTRREEAESNKKQCQDNTYSGHLGFCRLAAWMCDKGEAVGKVRRGLASIHLQGESQARPAVVCARGFSYFVVGRVLAVVCLMELGVSMEEAIVAGTGYSRRGRGMTCFAHMALMLGAIGESGAAQGNAMLTMRRAAFSDGTGGWL